MASLPTPTRLRRLSTRAQHVNMPDISQGEQCNSPPKDTSSVGHPSPMPPISADYLAKRAKTAAKKTERQATWANQRSADPDTATPDADGTAADITLGEALNRKQHEAEQQTRQEAAERKQKEVANCKLLEAAQMAERERLATSLEASSCELVAKRLALLGGPTPSASSSCAHGRNAIVLGPIPQQQEGSGFFLYLLMHNDVTNSTGSIIQEDAHSRGSGVREVQSLCGPGHTNKGNTFQGHNRNQRYCARGGRQ